MPRRPASPTRRSRPAVRTAGRTAAAVMAALAVGVLGLRPVLPDEGARTVGWPAPAVRLARPSPTTPSTTPKALRAPAQSPSPTRASRAARRAPLRLPPCRDGVPTARGNAALATLRADWRRVGVRPRFAGPRSGVLGETKRPSGAVVVFVRPCAQQSTALLRHVIAHELGHAWDVTRLSPAQRIAYKRARGIPVRTPWFGCSGCSDFATPAGDFAETYSLWLRQGTGSRSRMAPTPTPAQLADLARRFFGAS